MIRFELNGASHEYDGEPAKPLLWYVRETAGLTGTKFGCGVAQCGACIVYIDGKPGPSCTMPMSALEGKSVTTIEGLDSAPAEAVIAAWRALDVVQCGYCQSGQIMSAAALLAGNPQPSDAEIDSAMRGNLCRCATYQRIRAAIHDAARRLEA